MVIRPSFTLGGTGGGFVHTAEEFDEKLNYGLHASPVHEVLVEQSILGWKEYELELLRDANDNVIIICSIENFDPMGIHTGDSVTVAPAMTLPDTVYQRMRDLAIKCMNGIGHFAGGCNIQFALNPDNEEEIIVIEINPRVSRSSALASKATGYPIAKVAAKLAIGYHLDELKNSVTGSTSAFFEPALDYVIVKIPRWNFDKFKGADRHLGLQMKSVGESMGIGRTFQEALQKAAQSLEIKRNGLGADGRENTDQKFLLESLANPSWNRLFHIYDAFKLGIPLKTIQKLTKIDFWFLKQIEELIDFEKELKKFSVDTITYEMLTEAKAKGYGDRQIAHLIGCLESQVYKKREELGVKRVWKIVDTCAAEFEAKTPYYYSTFGAENESVRSDKKKIIVLGSGPNRIGQGIEFDYSCVHGVLAAKEMGYETIMINCNPETVSTDYDTSDRLYFEPLTLEDVMEIYRAELKAGPILGVIVQLGGQTPLGLAAGLQAAGVPILGTAPEAIHLAEDRGAFGEVLTQTGLRAPQFGTAYSYDEALKVATLIGYPLLVRPSFVLGGRGMQIVYDDASLSEFIDIATKINPEHPVLIDKFLDDAIEIDVDALYDGENLYLAGVMEHVEEAGVHSGDSACVIPSQSLEGEMLKVIEEATRKLAQAIGVRGLINIQFAISQSQLYVLEANPRASRTVPFVSKATGVQVAKAAALIACGKSIKELQTSTLLPQSNQGNARGVSVKEAVLPWNRFRRIDGQGVDSVLGPEMKSTGEAIRFVKNLRDPYFRQLYKDRSMYLSK